MKTAFFLHYVTGIEDIDLEHLRILELIEKITKASKNNQHELGISYLAELQILKNDHFLKEEVMMEKVNFPYLEYHQTNHRRIIFELESFINDYKAKITKLNSSKLMTLVLEHIDSFDRQYISYYNSWLAKNPV